MILNPDFPQGAVPVAGPPPGSGTPSEPEVAWAPPQHEAEPLVDPAVARAKFEQQVADYRRMEKEYIQRGWLMVRAEFPEVVVLFAAPQLAPPAVLFGVVIDFTNYDLWAPSVRFVEPFTLRPLHATEAPKLRKRPAPAAPVMIGGGGVANAPKGGEAPPEQMPNGAALPFGIAGLQLMVQPQPQNLVQAMNDGVPFLCVAGVREYHEHPFHSNDPWLAHRATGVGTLVHLLEVIHRHAIQPLRQWKYHVAVQVHGMEAELDPDQLPT